MSFHVGRYVFKRADCPDELEQIHALNYATFVQEIPQHADLGDGRLVDKFHAKNQYFVAISYSRVVGMVSTHDQPPFSVANRLPEPEVLHAPGVCPLEVRLLAICPEHRGGVVFAGLLWAVYQHACGGRYTHLFISAIEARLNMYEQLGFQAMGPAVGVEPPRFVPMAMPVSRIDERHGHLVDMWTRRLEKSREAHNEERVVRAH
jgi:hypothetical protein